jgi:DNA-binding XRE family transcriptional regulator
MAKEGKTDRFHDKFPTRLRGLIEEKGVTQVALASLLGISRQSFSAYCDGSTQPNIENTIKMANYFGVSVDYLFGLSDIRTTDPATKSLCETLGLSDEAVNIIQNDDTARNVIRFLLDQHSNAEKNGRKPGWMDMPAHKTLSLVSMLNQFLTICQLTTDTMLNLHANGRISAEIVDAEEARQTTLVQGNDGNEIITNSISLFQYSANETMDYIADILNSYMNYKYQKNIFSKELDLYHGGRHFLNETDEES